MAFYALRTKCENIFEWSKTKLATIKELLSYLRDKNRFQIFNLDF